MTEFIPAFIVALREGLEAFLVIAILLKFLDTSKNSSYKKYAWYGLGSSIVVSLLLGLGLFSLSNLLGAVDNVAKLWESIASLIAVALIVTFIVWMIRHGAQIKAHVEKQAALNLSAFGIFMLSFIMVLREGAEIAIFSFAGKYTLLPILAGLFVSAIIVVLIFYSLVKVKLTTIFAITLAYLIIQAGYLAGYSVHEGLSAAKGLGYIESESIVYEKAFDVSTGVWSHKTGTIGLPLNVLLGWYSKPEWIQFLIQYLITLGLFGYWYQYKKRESA